MVHLNRSTMKPGSSVASLVFAEVQSIHLRVRTASDSPEADYHVSRVPAPLKFDASQQVQKEHSLCCHSLHQGALRTEHAVREYNRSKSAGKPGQVLGLEDTGTVDSLLAGAASEEAALEVPVGHNADIAEATPDRIVAA